MPLIGEKRPLTLSNAAQAPDAPGVYALFGDGEVTYYGSACNGQTLRSRLIAHLEGGAAPSVDPGVLFSVEVTRFALSRERALLEEHRRVSRNLPKHNRVAGPRLTRLRAAALQSADRAQVGRAGGGAR